MLGKAPSSSAKSCSWTAIFSAFGKCAAIQIRPTPGPRTASPEPRSAMLPQCANEPAARSAAAPALHEASGGRSAAAPALREASGGRSAGTLALREGAGAGAQQLRLCAKEVGVEAQ